MLVLLGMKEFGRYILYGGFSMKRMLLTLATIVMVCFSYTLIIQSPSAHALDAQWKSDSIITHDGHDYIKGEPIKASDPRGMPEGTIPFAYTESVNDTQKTHILYVKAGIDPPSSASSVEYMIYNYKQGPPEQYTPLSTIETVAVTDKNSSPPSSCTGGFTSGVGWIICPLSRWLATGVDSLYGVLVSFFDVNPLTTTREGLYILWEIMLSLANTAFVIAFLVIIYSQLTGYGLSNYSIKSILPRLIVAAILVNLSYWICAAAIDLSNIAGHSLQALFMGIREKVAANVQISWADVTNAILSGGAVTAGTLGFMAATGGSIVSFSYILLASLISAAFSALAAVVILAVRQAFVAIFVIISPLAMVAYIFPNTEKYFDKWKDGFISLLIMFPIFAILFGGAQVAGAAIIQSADGKILVALIGMATQVAPLIVTPLILKFSSGILGQLANRVNNSKRGLVDRAKNNALDKAEYHKQRALGTQAGRLRGMRRGAQRMNRKKIQRDKDKASYQTDAETLAMKHKSWRKTDEHAKDAERDKQTVQNTIDAAYNKKQRTDRKSFDREELHRTSTARVEFQKQQNEKVFADIQAGDFSHLEKFHYASDLQRQAHAHELSELRKLSEKTAIVGMAKKRAEEQQQNNIADALLDNTHTIDGKSLRAYAGGILGEQGEYSALASAVATKRKQYGESIGDMEELRKHFNPSSEALQNLLVKGIPAIGTDSQGRTFEFTRNNIYAMEAAIEKQVAVGNVDMVDQIIQLSGSDLAEYRTSIADALAKAGHTSRSIYQGGPLIDFIAQGKIANERDLTGYIQDLMIKGKFSPDQLATADEGALKRFLRAAQEPAVNPENNAKLTIAIHQLREKANTALTDSLINSKIKDNAEPILKNIRDL